MSLVWKNQMLIILIKIINTYIFFTSNAFLWFVTLTSFHLVGPNGYFLHHPVVSNANNINDSSKYLLGDSHDYLHWVYAPRLLQLGSCIFYLEKVAIVIYYLDILFCMDCIVIVIDSKGKFSFAAAIPRLWDAVVKVNQIFMVNAFPKKLASFDIILDKLQNALCFYLKWVLRLLVFMSNRNNRLWRCLLLPHQQHQFAP